MSRIQYWRMEKGTNITISPLLRVLDAHNIILEDFFSEEEKTLSLIFEKTIPYGKDI